MARTDSRRMSRTYTDVGSVSLLSIPFLVVIATTVLVADADDADDDYDDDDVEVFASDGPVGIQKRYHTVLYHLRWYSFHPCSIAHLWAESC